MNSLKEIAEQLKLNNDMILVGHAVPDGDCVGSILALYQGLQDKGKRVRVLLQDPAPQTYNYLEGIKQIESPLQVEGFKGTAVFLDCSDPERAGENSLQVLKNRSSTINIDHHRSNTYFADYNYVDWQAAATAEIVYQLLLKMKIEITADIANALYAGIIMDTGSFLNGNTTSQSMRISADLMDKGADVNAARVNLFESKLREETLLLQLGLQTLSFSEDGKIAWMLLPYEAVKGINALDLFPEGIINYTRMIKGVEVGLLFRETEPGQVKIGFRSKEQVDVASLAAEFGGGGHRQAAGARQGGSLNEVSQKVVARVKDVIG